MVNNTDIDTGANDQVVNETQGKVFTQDEVNSMIEKRLKREQSKYSEVNVDEYKEMKAAKDKAENDRLMKRNEFDKILQKQKEKYDSETQSLRQKLESIQLDGALTNAAVQHKAVNPQHVTNLLRQNVRLDEEGNVLVLDGEGQVRYNQETAKPYSIDDLVTEFVGSNPYFRSASPSGTGSQGNTVPSNPKQSFDLSRLDPSTPEGQTAYKEYISSKNKR